MAENRGNHRVAKGIPFVALFRMYPGRTATITLVLLGAGLAEALGIATLLPALSLLFGTESDSGPAKIVADALAIFSFKPVLSTLLLLIVGAMFLKTVFVMGAMTLAARGVAAMARDFRRKLLNAMMAASWTFFTGQPGGKLANSLGAEIERISAGYLNAARLVANLIQVVVYTGLALLVSWQITIAALAAGVLIFFILHSFISAGRMAGKMTADGLDEISRLFVDGWQGMKGLKAMGAQAALSHQMDAQTQLINRGRRKDIQGAESMRNLQDFLVIVFLAGGLGLAIKFAGMPLAGLLFLALLFQRLMSRINILMTLYRAVIANEAFFTLYNEKLDSARSMEERSDGVPAPRFSREIVLENVAFSYAEAPALRGVDISIRANRVVAIIGESGAGKTTVADLLVGFYRSDSGTITIDGKPLDDINLASWRQQIGYVPQELFLFHDSIRSNVAAGNETYTDEDIESALKLAGAWGFVSALPEGIGTIVGERGSRLSGGQRQRIALARALVRRPTLLILDEPTAALDAQTAAELSATLKALSGETTIFVISHQTSIASIADHVYEMKLGRVTKHTEQQRVDTDHNETPPA